ncbi:MAG: sigma-70 family RNA polymerase sigma factor [Bacteroidia bacterium]|nr:sigma-70 family RNA polymerase sigma factor [Bacteroidia bacterium]
MTTIEFGTQIQDHKEILRNYALKLTQDMDDANDLVQETYLKSLTYSTKFKKGTNLKGWMMTIMRNNFINNYRRNTKRNTFMDTQEEQYIIDSAKTYNTFNNGETKFIREDLERAIDTLPQDLRLTFEMNTLGFKYHEIAEKLNIPIGTVKTRIFVARRKLREELADYKQLYNFNVG